MFLGSIFSILKMNFGWFIIFARFSWHLLMIFVFNLFSVETVAAVLSSNSIHDFYFIPSI